MKNVSKDVCPFCGEENELDVIERGALFSVTRARFEYDTWDDIVVDEHLMLVPNRHVVLLGGLTDEERAEFLRQVSDFEARGYSVYARAPHDPTRTIAHQHTHLIKLGGNRIRAKLYVRKPHIRAQL